MLFATVETLYIQRKAIGEAAFYLMRFFNAITTQLAQAEI